MEDSIELDGSPLSNKKPVTRRKFAKEVYKPANRKLPPNSRLWGSENANRGVKEGEASKKAALEPEEGTKKVPPKKDAKAAKPDKIAPVKEKAGRKAPSRGRLTDKSNAQTETAGRPTRAAQMTNDRAGRAKMAVFAEEAAEEGEGTETGTEAGRDEDGSFLDVSADHRLMPNPPGLMPTQQSLAPDVTFTFDAERHARALARYSPIPRSKSTVKGSTSTSTSTGDRKEPTLQTHSKMGPAPKLPTKTKPEPKKRIRCQAPKAKAPAPARAAKEATEPLSDDPLMI